MKTKRSHRRTRHLKRLQLQKLDRQIKARINRSYIAAMETWGATRCPDCGIQVRPHWLVYPGEGQIIEDGKVIGFITMGVLPPCDRAKECKGETPNWEIKASDRYCRKVARGEVKL